MTAEVRKKLKRHFGSDHLSRVKRNCVQGRDAA